MRVLVCRLSVPATGDNLLVLHVPTLAGNSDAATAESANASSGPIAAHGFDHSIRGTAIASFGRAVPVSRVFVGGAVPTVPSSASTAIRNGYSVVGKAFLRLQSCLGLLSSHRHHAAEHRHPPARCHQEERHHARHHK